MANRRFFRPYRSARRPPMRAPKMVPTVAMATVSPIPKSSSLNLSSRASLAPDMTAVSKPKIRPPMAATTALLITRAFTLSRGADIGLLDIEGLLVEKRTPRPLETGRRRSAGATYRHSTSSSERRKSVPQCGHFSFSNAGQPACFQASASSRSPRTRRTRRDG